MKVLFLGTSHGYPEKNRFCSSTAVLVGEKCYLIDAGAPITTLLLSHDIPLKNVQAVFITHPHDDHYFGLAEFSRTVGRYGIYQGVHVDVFSPRPFLYAGFLSWKYFLKISGRVRYRRYRAGVVFDDGTVKVTAIPVRHCPDSYAFCLEAEGKKILFSGDLQTGMRDYPKVLFEKPFDMLVLEGAHTPLGSKAVLEKLNSSKIERLFINHVSPKTNPKEAIEEAFGKVNPAVSCTVAEDGMVVEV